MASIRLADPMLPALARDFGSDVAQAAAVITFFTLAYGAMQLVWGPLGDRLGVLRVIGWAAVASAAGSLACAAAPTLGWLTAARLVTGACCAAIIPLAIAFVGDSVAYEARQATLARMATGTLTGMVAGQVLGGLAADTFGWRSAFAAIAAVFAAAGVAVLRRRSRLAAAGSPFADARAAQGSALRRWADVLADPWARAVFAVGLLEGGLVFGALAFVPAWLHERTGTSLTAAGGAVAAFGLGGLAFATTARRWIPRLGERGMLTGGGVLVAVGFAALAAVVHGVPAGQAWIGALPCCAVAGLGFYMLHNTMQTLATQLAPEARATAVGLFAVSLFIGQSAGVALAARIGATVGHGVVVVAGSAALAAACAAMGVAVERRRRRGR